MTYYDIDTLKKSLEKADVILSHGDSILSWIIRIVTQSYWNHSSMYIGDEKFIEADGNGVIIKNISKLSNRDIRIYRYKKATKNVLDKIINEAKSYNGKKYDIFAILELFWLFIVGKRGDPRRIGSKNRFICSEIISQPYYKFGYPVIEKYDYDEVTPSDFDISKNFRRLEI
jgi:uncharacterized protein YycO|tara:strand:+ start:192 stop:707 length:516 start_codon:yes stop_codon:yes gene_type:complete